jgi:hypothetical protein
LGVTNRGCALGLVARLAPAAVAARSRLDLGVASRGCALGLVTRLAALLAAPALTLALPVLLRLVPAALLGRRIGEGGDGPCQARHRSDRDEKVEFHGEVSFFLD